MSRGIITFEKKINFEKTSRYFEKLSSAEFQQLLNQNAQEGVDALSAATPKDSGLTASCWGYQIETGKSGIRIIWTNSNVNKGVPIAIILQYGHGTGTGGYVAGRDYINPAIKPVFERIKQAIAKELRG